jgi:hypothetical protein
VERTARRVRPTDRTPSPRIVEIVNTFAFPASEYFAVHNCSVLEAYIIVTGQQRCAPLGEESQPPHHCGAATGAKSSAEVLAPSYHRALKIFLALQLLQQNPRRVRLHSKQIHISACSLDNFPLFQTILNACSSSYCSGWIFSSPNCLRHNAQQIQ